MIRLLIRALGLCDALAFPFPLAGQFQEHLRRSIVVPDPRRLRDRHRAADVAQETWIKLAKIDPPRSRC